MCSEGGKREVTPAEMQMFQRAGQEIKYWKNNFRDIEDQQIQQAKRGVFSERDRETARGRAHIATVNKLSKQAPSNPNGGMLPELMRRAVTGDALATASNAADTGMRAGGFNEMLQLAKFGRGQEGLVFDGMSKNAQLAAGSHAAEQAVAKAAADFNIDTAMGIVGTVAGMGMGGGGGAGKMFQMGGSDFSKGKNGVIFNESTGMAIDMGRD